MENPWIEWQGGECPVPPDTLVDVIVSCGPIGSTVTGKPAKTWPWHDNLDMKVTSYRLSKTESGQKSVSGDAGCYFHPDLTSTVPSEAHHSGDAPTWRDQVALEFAKSRILTGKSYVLDGLVETSYAFADLMIAEREKKK
ncbi:MAG: hypothetical protein AB7F19_07885 [Candidatus Babeliales bacterium]